MLSDGAILFTHTARKTQELLQKLSGKSGATLHTAQIWHPIWAVWRVMWKSLKDSDVLKPAENWLNGQGRDFYQAGLNKLVLRSHKCLKRFGDYVAK
ncbi:hypothetical protein AVEN_118503-1 [Araneus ventricosus]|uniref:Uncharacterized protein n=1 Tax=Araneus ventricosus TaxID=182803 RepID=A0A4Y2H933_ARAVE|nr:hypothetical protein AVEN_196733-1 [Araneus ventricosus]GBM83432.1 hypothetical protein AVEN_118503-1 [Araneus ventricosus]